MLEEVSLLAIEYHYIFYAIALIPDLIHLYWRARQFFNEERRLYASFKETQITCIIRNLTRSLKGKMSLKGCRQAQQSDDAGDY